MRPPDPLAEDYFERDFDVRKTHYIAYWLNDILQSGLVSTSHVLVQSVAAFTSILLGEHIHDWNEYPTLKSFSHSLFNIGKEKGYRFFRGEHGFSTGRQSDKSFKLLGLEDLHISAGSVRITAIVEHGIGLKYVAAGTLLAATLIEEDVVFTVVSMQDNHLKMDISGSLQACDFAALVTPLLASNISGLGYRLRVVESLTSQAICFPAPSPSTVQKWNLAPIFQSQATHLPLVAALLQMTVQVPSVPALYGDRSRCVLVSCMFDERPLNQGSETVTLHSTIEGPLEVALVGIEPPMKFQEARAAYDCGLTELKLALSQRQHISSVNEYWIQTLDGTLKMNVATHYCTSAATHESIIEALRLTEQQVRTWCVFTPSLTLDHETEHRCMYSYLCMARRTRFLPFFHADSM